MASVLLFVFFLLSHLLLLQSAVGEMNYTQKCPLFSCGNLSSIGFPFTKNSHPHCGVFNLECDDSEASIQLRHGERPIPFFNISPSNTLHIRDKELAKHLTTPPCEPLTTFFRTSFFSFEIVSSQTFFFKCYHTLDVHPPPDFKNVSCGDSHIFFSNSSKEGFPGAFSECSSIPLPQNLDPNGLRNGSDPSSYVAAEFDLQVHVSPECYACFDKGGQCKEYKGRFHCDGVKEDSAAERLLFNEKCPPSRCGNLLFIGFPFALQSNPECGVFTVDCREKNSTIQLERQGRSYPLLGIFEYNFFRIFDEELSERLKSRSCESFTNFTLPSSSFFSFEIVRNHTFFKCNRSLNVRQPPDFKTKDCSDSVIYYNPSNENSTGAFSGCSIIQLPKNLGQDSHWPAKFDDPFSLVTPYIDLEVNVSYECYECYEKGGQCKARANGKFYCKKGLSKKQKIGICVGSSVGVLCLALIIYWGKSRGVLSKMPAKRTQSAASARSDVEAGSVYFGVPVYSYSELEEATNNFDVERELGDGGFGTVYYGKLRDGREVAIKRLYEHNSKRVAQFMNEVEILTRLRHMNLVSLYGCTSRRSRELLLVYEYIPNGTVADHIHGDRAAPGSPPWPTRMSIAIETASALAYLHASEIIHRDVKTNNILLDHNFCVKVADFGISRLFPFNVTHVSTAPQGTPGYVDPEYYQCYQLSTKSDVYSFGIVLVELISSLPAVDLARHQHDINLASLALKRIERSEYQELIDSHLGFEWDKEVRRMTISVAQLAFRCIQHDKELRPSMDEVLEVLKQIQRGNEALDDGGKAFDNDGIMNIKPPTSQDSR